MRARLHGPTAYAQAVRDYLGHFRSLGARYRGVECILRRLGRYLSNQAVRDLDSSHYEGWRQSQVTLHPNSRRKAEQKKKDLEVRKRRVTGVKGAVTDPGYLTYPTNLVKTVSEVPGSGGSYSAVTPRVQTAASRSSSSLSRASLT